MKQYLILLIFSISIVSCKELKTESIDEKQFKKILWDISTGWNSGDAKLAAKFFAENAVYEEPPKKQFYKGSKEIFEFFGGDKGYDIPMKMKWRNLAFNEEAQIGFGEYTFEMNSKYHGIVILQFKSGKIVKWREYQYKTELDWKEFAGESEFETVE